MEHTKSYRSINFSKQISCCIIPLPDFLTAFVVDDKNASLDKIGSLDRNVVYMILQVFMTIDRMHQCY